LANHEENIQQKINDIWNETQQNVEKIQNDFQNELEEIIEECAQTKFEKMAEIKLMFKN